MQKVLTNDLWPTVRTYAKAASQRKAAIAYVTQDLVGFRKGDVLIVDASRLAISSGETAAPLLRSLYRKGVTLYHCDDLHAKVFLLGDVAVISSGNMSNSSKNVLVEVGVLTDHASTVSGVESLIQQLIVQSDELGVSEIAELCNIKVVRRGGRANTKSKRVVKIAKLGTQTWLVGVRTIVRENTPKEQILITKAETSLRKRLNLPANAQFDRLRWTGNGKFVRECREGNSVIQIWRENDTKMPSRICRSATVLLIAKQGKWTHMFLPMKYGKHAEMPYPKFCNLLKSVGYLRHPGPRVEHLLDEITADAIKRNWAGTINK